MLHDISTYTRRAVAKPLGRAYRFSYSPKLGVYKDDVRPWQLMKTDHGIIWVAISHKTKQIAVGGPKDA